jgi:tetratricopeptide (TPR) repeat protein
MFLHRLNKYQDAIEKFEKAIELEPNYVDAYLNLGIILSEIGKYKESIEKFKKVTNLDDSSIEAYFN